MADTPVVTPGAKTSEFKLASIVAILGIVGTVAPPLWVFLTNVSESFPEVRWLATIASGVGMLVTCLVSLGYSKSRGAVKSAALGAPKGFARLATLLAVAALCVTGCAVLSKTSGSTGEIDLGKGVKCSVTVAPVDAPTCTKALSQACEFPLPRAADGACQLDAIVTSIPFSPGQGWSCKVSATAGLSPCTKLLTTACTAPTARDAAGACLP